MTTTTFTIETSAPSVSGVLEALVRTFHALQRRRARRLALGALLEMDSSRLDDLGISAQDVVDALHAPNAGSRLEARRSATAGSWRPRAVSAA